MRFWTACTFLALGFIGQTWAAGNGGHGSVADLFAPAVNVILLGAFLVWKLKGPLRNMFITKSEEVANTLERASLKSKEAEILLQNEEKKLAGLDNEIKKIAQQAEADILSYEKNLARELEEKSHKLKTDANLKILADKKSILDQLNAELLDQVIDQAKTTIKGNKEFQTKASTKLIQGL